MFSHLVKHEPNISNHRRSLILIAALEEAAWNGRLDAVRFLVREGTDPYAKRGRALIAALQEEYTEMTKFLLDSMNYAPSKLPLQG